MTLHLEADAPTLQRTLSAQCPEMPPLPTVRRQLLDYQMIALVLLAREYNRPGAQILEIGTGGGGSGYLLSRAAPQARILSLTTSEREQQRATTFWRQRGCGNVSALLRHSWALLAENQDLWDLVFVDGDHNRIALDLPWYDRLRPGGLFLCHDYSPQDSRAPSGIVYEELNKLAARFGRPFDVRVVDDGKVGMVGFYRRAEEMVGVEPAVVARLPVPCVGGLALRSTVPALSAKAAQAEGIEVCLTEDWALRWPRTLFASVPFQIPWGLMRAGFALLEKWDLLAPFTAAPLLAQDCGTAEDRERTQAILHDLRVPVYEPGFVFVRDTEMGRSLIARWRMECDGGDERLAFLRALYAVKPRFCVLPRSWLDGAALKRSQQSLPPKAGGRR